MMPFSFFVRLILTCQACGNPVPVGELAESAACTQCGQTFSPLDVLEKVCKPDDELLEVTEIEMNMGRPVTIMAPFQASFLYARCQRCQTCKADFHLSQYASAKELGGFHCGGCSTWHKQRPASERLKAIVPGLSLVIGETSMEPTGPSAPVVYPCAQCKGTLQPDGKERVVTCSYCQASNFLPDSLWEHLHKQPQAPKIFLVCEDHSAEQVNQLLRALR